MVYHIMIDEYPSIAAKIESACITNRAFECSVSFIHIFKAGVAAGSCISKRPPPNLGAGVDVQFLLRDVGEGEQGETAGKRQRDFRGVQVA